MKQGTIYLLRPLFQHLLPVPRAHQEAEIIPLSIAYMVTQLEQSGMRVIVADNAAGKGHYDKKEIVQTFLRERPDIVGLSCFCDNRYACREVAALAKKIDPGIQVVWGGEFSTFLYEKILEKWPSDFVVLNEGERSFPELCRCLVEGRDFSGVRGIAYRKKGRVVRTAAVSPIQNLDDLPLPAYHRFSLEENNMGLLPKKIKMLRLDTSRGCPYSCSFCSSERMCGRRVRFFSLERVLRDIAFLKKKYRCHFFSFTDLNLTTHPARLEEFCSLLIRRKAGISWLCNGRADGTLTPGRLRKMKRSGCSAILFGIESFSSRVLASVRKNIDARMQVDVIRRTYDAGIGPCLSMLFGLPAETQDTLEETLLQARKLPPITHAAMNRYALYPGSDIYEREVRQRTFDEEKWFDGLDHSLTYPSRLVTSLKIQFFMDLFKKQVTLISRS